MALSQPDIQATSPAPSVPKREVKREVMYRHTIGVRVTHWVNALALVLLLMSGLRLFNYHPALYWGNDGHKGMPSFISINAFDDIETDEPVGVTTIAGHNFITTGVLGVSYDANGEPITGAFPNWMTLPGGPGLALARGWHFAMAWRLCVRHRAGFNRHRGKTDTADEGDADAEDCAARWFGKCRRVLV